MLKLLPTSINLGLRPTGLYETVDLQTGKVSFHSEDPLGDPIDNLLTLPNEIPFSSRSPDWLLQLRLLRTQILIKPKAVRKPSSKKPPTQESSSATPKATRKPRSKKPPSAAALLLGGDDPYALFR